mmetsp:Transcript_19842/g.29727  ORF Transcript_19842/g.29727 Transcript_19842/m.29727 type:complete len:99 (+) Transcript_19842:121-417(+)
MASQSTATAPVQGMATASSPAAPGNVTEQIPKTQGNDETSSTDEEGPPPTCIYCQKEPTAFVCDPCRHGAACKKCAMRMATGGRCRVCKEMFSGWRRC